MAVTCRRQVSDLPEASDDCRADGGRTRVTCGADAMWSIIGDFMTLADHLVRSGDTLFRWRGQLPLLMFPLFVLGLLDARLPAVVPAGLRIVQVAAVVVALAGLLVRVVAVGTAPEGTSERSTTNPRASRLRTTGLYSLVRHPLYVGNTVTAVGLAAFTTRWYVPAIVLLLGLLYHERIAAREEAFLEERFGAEFRAWTDRVPAMVPRLSAYVASDTPFLWRRVLGREFHGLMVIASVVFVLDLSRLALAGAPLRPEPIWGWFFAASALLFVVLTAIKKTTKVFQASVTRNQAH
jgi:protein-S-isoprenylcysteine O-methyltransferase Ste14